MFDMINNRRREWTLKFRAAHAFMNMRSGRGALGGLAFAIALTTASFAADNRVSAAAQRFWVEQVAEGLKFPSSMVWLPSGDMLIAERAGGLRVIRDGNLNPTPITGIPISYQVGLNGIKEVLLDPDYQSNQRLYLLISEGNFNRYHAAVFRGRYGTSGLTDVTRIFRSKDAMSGGHSIAGRMLFLTDKTLLVAITSSTDGNKELAQQLDSHIGKIIRINRDGSVPPDNPFLKTPGALPEIWSYGHRVQLALYRDQETDEIWEVDSGPRGGDEINLLRAGANFGWAKASWGFGYDNKGAATPVQTASDIEEPVLVWTPSVTPSGFTRYYGNVFPHWHGDYFVGHLTAKVLERLHIEGRRVTLQERILLDIEERIRDVKVGPDGRIYVLTDNHNGRVLRLQPGRPGTDQLSRVAHKLEAVVATRTPGSEVADLTPGDPAKGRQAFLQHCSACHSVGEKVQGGHIGPDLDGVYGRTAGSKQGYAYSQAMAGSSSVWEARTLTWFIANPTQYLPGTKMVAPPLTDPQTRRDLVGFLMEDFLQTKADN